MRDLTCTKIYADEAAQSQTGEEIFQLFLLDNSRVKSFVLFTKRLDCNSACTNLAALENRTNDMRNMRSVGNT